MALAKDVIFELSDYNVPKIINNADAWAEMVLNLLFLENGTYSDAPDIGLDLKAHTYMEVSDIITYITEELNRQVGAYMPGIPLSNITVQTAGGENADNNVLYVTLSFNINDKAIHKSAFVSLTDEIVNMVVDNYQNNTYSNI
jgi:hypothetical protein